MTTEFTTIGPDQLYSIPPGYNTFDIECWGTQGGNSGTNPRAPGGYIKARFTGLTSNLLIDIGDVADTSKYHGGTGSFGGGAGAGARLDMVLNPLIVAGGGGGGTGLVTLGGAGGGLIGADGGFSGLAASGKGGTHSAGGTVGGMFGVGGNGTGTGGNKGGGGGGFYGGGGGSGNSGNGGGGGGSNGITMPLPSGVQIIGSIITLRGGDVAIPTKPGNDVTIGAVRITPICFLALYTGQLVDYTVPEGVQCLDVQLWGGRGGPSFTLGPSLAGYCQGQIQVNPGDLFNLSVGQAGSGGSLSSAGGLSPGNYCPGGNGNLGSPGDGGGGGAGTAVIFGSSMIIAAGGGGGASFCDTAFPGGDGGAIVGADGVGYPLSGQGGQIGAPGAGGIGITMNGSPGVGGAGGDGAQGPANCGTGGGGGGFWGGGGGGTGDNNIFPFEAGSGGGGSSNYDPASPRSVLLFDTIPDITAPANPDSVTGNGAICIVPAACVCVAEGTLVQTSQGLCLIERLKPGDLVPTADGSMDIVRQIIQNKAVSSQLIQCEANCFSKDSPLETLLITPTHPMLIKGYEMNGRQLVDSSVQGVSLIRNSDRIPVYTVITDRRTFINMNGVPVGTWSEASWNNFIDNDGTAQYL